MRMRGLAATIRRILLRLAEMIRELVGSMFYLCEYSFTDIPISRGTMLISEVGAVGNGLEPRPPVNEQCGVMDVVSLQEWPSEPVSQCDRSRRKQPDIEEFIRVWIDDGVQPVAVVVELNHRLVNGDVGRYVPVGGL